MHHSYFWLVCAVKTTHSKRIIKWRYLPLPGILMEWLLVGNRRLYIPGGRIMGYTLSWRIVIGSPFSVQSSPTPYKGWLNFDLYCLLCPTPMPPMFLDKTKDNLKIFTYHNYHRCMELLKPLPIMAYLYFCACTVGINVSTFKVSRVEIK